MKKYIITTLLILSLLAVKIAFAGLLITKDTKIPGIDFNGRKTELIILKDSEADYFLATKGVFEVTNPTSLKGFNVATKDEEVKTLLLMSADNKVVLCEENKDPGKSFLHINNLKGKFRIVPSKIETCEKAFNLNENSQAVLASFFEDMTPEQKEKLVLELGKIALIIFIGHTI